MLQDKLENEMYSRIKQNGKYCTLIVMHPGTWRDLIKEVIVSHGTAIRLHDPELKYRGIKVLRSLDMVEGLFEVR